jgi:integrase
MQVKREAKIWPRKLPSGNTSFRVDLGKINGKRVTKDFPREMEAQKFAAKANEQFHRRNLGALQDLVESQRYEILSCLQKLKPFNASLNDAVDFFIRYAQPPQAAVSVEKAIQLFVAEKRKAKRRERYIEAIQDSYLTPLKKRFPKKMVNEFTTKELDKFVHVKGRASSTVMNYIRSLGAFFNFLVEKGYCTLNPMAKIVKPSVEDKATAFLTPEDTALLLQKAMDDGHNAECACMVLVLFCGVRVEEVAKLNWKDVNLKTRFVEISGAIAKKAKRRANTIPLNACEWLRLCASDGPIAPRNYVKRMHAIRKAAGIRYVQNAMRHSFASYHLAMFEDSPKTAFQLGHPNPTLLYNTYRELTTKADAERFWDILPRSVVESRRAEIEKKRVEANEAARIEAESQSNCGQAVWDEVSGWLSVHDETRKTDPSF